MTKEEFRTALGSRLRARRKELHLSLQAVGRTAGLSFGFLSQIEMGRNFPSLDALYRVTRALDLSLVALFISIDAARPEPEVR